MPTESFSGPMAMLLQLEVDSTPDALNHVDTDICNNGKDLMLMAMKYIKRKMPNG